LRNDSTFSWHTEEDMLDVGGSSGYMLFYVRSDILG